MRVPLNRTALLRPPSRVVQGESSQHRMIGESRIRLICIAAFFSLCFSALGLRLIEVTLIGGGDFPFKRLVMEPQLLLERDDDVDVSKVADTQRIVRHEIVDRNGMVLATSIQTASLVANPNLIRDEDVLAKQLHGIFPRESAAEFYEKLMRKRSNFLYLQRHLTPAQQEAVNNLGIPGLFFEPDMRRVYPYGALFSHTLGYVGIDNDGLAGIEKNFNERLRDGSNDQPTSMRLVPPVSCSISPPAKLLQSPACRNSIRISPAMRTKMRCSIARHWACMKWVPPLKHLRRPRRSIRVW